MRLRHHRPIAATAVALLVVLGLSACSSTKKAAAAPAAPAGAVTFQSVSITGATDLTSKPGVTATSTSAPTALQEKDLVVGQGPAATSTSTVTVQYVGVRYTDGHQFDASWNDQGPASFPLNGVVPGFAQGIGGAAGIAPMKVGGRRVMILPAALGYGASGTPDGSIPPNTPIVFVVDLLAVK